VNRADQFFFFLLVACLACGCRRDMFDQPKGKPLAESHFFDNGAMAREFPPHTVARGQLEADDRFFSGKIGTNLLETIPARITSDVLRRGRERFDIYCAPCHGRTGDGDGIVVRRGFPAPPSLHIDRLRGAPAGHIFDVITRGYGVMYSQASRVEPGDRWAIVAYVRALQLAGHAAFKDVPVSERAKLQ